MTLRKIDRFDWRDDLLISVYEHNIGIFTHDLADDRFFASKAHVIVGFKDKHDHALKGRLLCTQKSCRGKMLAQHHAKHRRCHGVFLLTLGNCDVGVIVRCGNDQTAITLLRTEGQNDLILFRLRDLIQTRRCEHTVTLAANCGRHRGVKCHISSPFRQIL